jgi:hypothetical protein
MPARGDRARMLRSSQRSGRWWPPRRSRRTREMVGTTIPETAAVYVTQSARIRTLRLIMVVCFLITSRNPRHAPPYAGSSRVVRAVRCSLSTPLPPPTHGWGVFTRLTASSSPLWGHAPNTSLVLPVDTAECGLMNWIWYESRRTAQTRCSLRVDLHVPG